MWLGLLKTSARHAVLPSPQACSLMVALAQDMALQDRPRTDDEYGEVQNLAGPFGQLGALQGDH